ncbi:BEN domain containing 2 [Rhinolophus ferrumequinum]|uniref:BEN domain containing 2 n=1 Tax=Rhinolophus ferrumequinum TaxID=59479 RepID=A0A7J8ATH8_RHIFE|nr:BEN domain containing 2 [Rhinolophus ferrumequinum]
MSKEQDYVVVTIDDSDDDNSDDVVIIEDSGTELTENTVSANGVLTIQPNSQGSSDNCQPPSQMLHEAEGLAALDNQRVSQMNHPANLKRCNPNSADVEFAPLNKKGHLSIPGKDDERLQDLMKSLSAQVNEFCGIFSKIQQSLEQPWLPNSASPAVRAAVLPEEEPNWANSPEMMNSTTLMGNKSVGPDAASLSLCDSPELALIPIKVLARPENGRETSHGTMTYPPVLENNNNQNSSSPPACNHYDFGFLGDPRRNVRILNFHLMTAQRKIEPKQAARYLVRVIFSKEVLICSSVGVGSYSPTCSGQRPLDPNKMAAIREYLAEVFPNHDLRECGKDWKACIAYINALIRYLCFYNTKKALGNTSVNNRVPTNPNMPVSAGLNYRKDGDGYESSFQLSQEAAALETRANGNSQQNSSAFPKGFIEPSTDDSKIPLDALTYVGNPSGNVQVPYKVLNTTKAKPCPEPSARYLIRNVVSEDILTKTNVHDNVTHGIHALDPNRITTLRDIDEVIKLPRAIL